MSGRLNCKQQMAPLLGMEKKTIHEVIRKLGVASRMPNLACKLRFILLVVGTVFLTACAGDLQSVIHPAGPQSEHIHQLWWMMFYVSSAVFLIVMVFAMLAVKRGQRKYRTAPNSLSVELNPPAEAEHRKGIVIIAATVATVVILFVFLVYSFLIGRGMTAEQASKGGVTIELTGHQWWWEVRYTNVDASSIFTTANEIHIPVGVPVTFSLKAADVIHSFWVPNLSGKKDLIPGKLATIWLQADTPGVYRGQCAEYCGLQHAHMALWVVAESREEFDAWLRNQIQPAVSPSSASAVRGQEVFLSSTCVMCHAINGTPAGSNIGPNLTHLASRKTIGAATLQNDRDHLAQWVVNSQQIKPGNRMPPNYLGQEDLQALLDYLQILK